jgi:uncharacterized protein YxeA
VKVFNDSTNKSIQMKKLLSIIALLTLFIVVNLSAQNTVSIYEVGIPVVKCEDNYKKHDCQLDKQKHNQRAGIQRISIRIYRNNQ